MSDQPKSQAAEREEEILKFWQEREIFKKSLEKHSPKGEFVFFEGPPTANGRPGIHHLASRSFKDAVPRYRTMRGYHVRRKAGWDTHGLPVELEVEKEIGSKSKKDIEAYGVAKFNQKCKESVLRYIDEWRTFSDRIAFWQDYDHTYFTFDNSYIESVWAVVKHAHERKLLYKDYKVVPWCPRCGTALSSHEVAQGYDEAKDPSVYVKFELIDHPGTYFLAWTTTPWTLPGNVALAVGADVEYSKVRVGEDTYILATERLDAVLGEGSYEVLGTMKGSEFAGGSYRPIFPFLAMANMPTKEREKMPNAYKVYTADFVSTEDGTGIVHSAVMYGTEDFELGTKENLPKFHLVKEDGTFIPEVGLFAGKFVKDADADVIDELKRMGALYKQEVITHTYPFCWRCKTPLLYYADTSWYIAMSQIKDTLIAENETINWEPAHIREGRFGEWLKDLKDWAISRSRYWGTPLPVWECVKCKAVEVMGSVAQLEERAGKAPEDLHRPYIDEPRFSCFTCGGEMCRVPDVMDVWFDSGAMPFAQDHHPFSDEPLLYPADFICEAIDQTRGWFYTLHAVGNIMGKGKAFRNVVCLGHILDAKGKKMSKSQGNIVVPKTVIDKYGVDALRYFMYSVNAPGESKNFDERLVDEILKKNFGRLGNVLSFYQLYQSDVARDWTSEHILDKWIIARLDELTTQVTDGFENYKLDVATRPMSLFIDDLSAWYLRRSRDRFKEDGPDKKAALATLRFVLHRLALLMAPTTPFFAEYLFQAVREGEDEESVHLAAWPEESQQPKFWQRLFGGDSARETIAAMEEARSLVTAALEARDKAGIKVRQPLGKLFVPVASKLPKALLDVIAEEVNVKSVERRGEVVELDTTMTDELREEGFVRDTIRAIQAFRKESGLKPGEHTIYRTAASDTDRALIERHRAEIEKTTTTTIEFT
ncbi:MAG TPA: isoleucine--tRNA ligase [Candidatus Paceibacterota bacterium]|nr:isoleucine--tRNA ligase [Candidatus Paceibacterota bacterium]